jgi:RNA polymerase sporulation-specific sigma factor
LLLDKEEREQVAANNMALIYYVVKMFLSSGVHYDELVSVAMVGYVKALNAFDKERNVKFSTYAINCIRNEILFFLRKEKRHMQNNLSMNFTLSNDKDGNTLSLGDTLEEESEVSVEETVMTNGDIDILYKAIDELSQKEQYVLTYRYGLDNGIVKTQKEIAEEIGMSQANVSKIERMILDKVKRLLRDKYRLYREF